MQRTARPTPRTVVPADARGTNRAPLVRGANPLEARVALARVTPPRSTIAHSTGMTREREQKRADEREDRRVRHRPEQRARRTRERIDRQEPRDDHRASRKRSAGPPRPRHSTMTSRDGVPGSVAPRELAVDVLHHHDRAVHEDAEVDGADGEQVGRDVPEIEADEREAAARAGSSPRRSAPTERRRGRRSGPRSTSRMPRSRLSSTVRVVSADQIAAIVERHDLDVLRQDRLVQLRCLRLDAP